MADVSFVTFNQDLSSGADLRAWTVQFQPDDTGPPPFAHNLPYTPTVIILSPVEVGAFIGANYSGAFVEVTGTMCTVTKRNTSLTGGIYTLYLGRVPNPQTER